MSDATPCSNYVFTPPARVDINLCQGAAIFGYWGGDYGADTSLDPMPITWYANAVGTAPLDLTFTINPNPSVFNMDVNFSIDTSASTPIGTTQYITGDSLFGDDGSEFSVHVIASQPNRLPTPGGQACLPDDPNAPADSSYDLPSDPDFPTSTTSTAAVGRGRLASAQNGKTRLDINFGAYCRMLWGEIRRAATNRPEVYPLVFNQEHFVNKHLVGKVKPSLDSIESAVAVDVQKQLLLDISLPESNRTRSYSTIHPCFRRPR